MLYLHKLQHTATHRTTPQHTATRHSARNMPLAPHCYTLPPFLVLLWFIRHTATHSLSLFPLSLPSCSKVKVNSIYPSLLFPLPGPHYLPTPPSLPTSLPPSTPSPCCSFSHAISTWSRDLTHRAKQVHISRAGCPDTKPLSLYQENDTLKTNCEKLDKRDHFELKITTSPQGVSFHTPPPQFSSP